MTSTTTNGAATGGPALPNGTRSQVDDGAIADPPGHQAATMGGAGPGWQELKSDRDDVEKDDTPRQNSSNGPDSVQGATVELEMGDLPRSRDAKSGDVDAEAGSHPQPTSGATTREYKVYKRRWFGLVQLMLLNIIVSWDWLTFSPVASQSAHYFKTTESAVNWLSTAFLFSFVCATPAAIYVLHFGPRPAIMTSALLVLVGNWIRFAGSHASSDRGGIFGVVMFGQILIGIAQPFVLSAPSRYSDLWFTNRGRVAATAVASLANPFGAALGQLIIPFWVDKPRDVSHMVLYVAIISSVCSIPSFFIPAKPPTPAAPSSETPKLGLQRSMRILFGHLEFWLILIPFSIYVGFFNSISSLINQILLPYGFDDTEAGIAGALLIVVGLVSSAITSPILDRTKRFLLAIKVAVPIIALCYLVFIWMPPTRSIAGPYVVLAVLGAASFSLVPVVVECLVELTHPISPEVTSTIAWSGGQLLGGCFIVISNALKAGPHADPPRNMHHALIFTAVLALVVLPLPMSLGLFGRRDRVVLKRVHSDEAATSGGGFAEARN
ncbi:hypothetical protein VTK73DRAFT_8806 [Phialemonium thermophilum]|uniref:Major facilitator superfamily (MFS) profile domain-containing protein n=1 Tax=Phialemonium thermophilum TaxID=223376 RepID=A0ABR3W6A7_9PEZI